MWLDKTGLPSWSLGLICFFSLTLLAFVLLIVERIPDPDIYRNSVAFIAIISFFLIFYFKMGRGWHGDILKLLVFDKNLTGSLDILEPSRKIVTLELLLASIAASINVFFSGLVNDGDVIFAITISLFFFLEYATILFSIDIIFRQLYSLTQIVRKIRVDLLDTEAYSTLANAMIRFVGLYIFGVCVITMSYLVFTEGETGAAEMLLIMMPWYLPGFVLMSIYFVPYSIFRKRIAVVKALELNRVALALKGDRTLLQDSLISADSRELNVIDLLYYQSLIRNIREWPFTTRIRSLILFGVLPPLTWVVAALIEILIEGAL